MRPFIKPECKCIWEEFVDDSFYASLNVAPGAIDVLGELVKKHEIYFVTAGHPYTMRARDTWLERIFPFYKSGSLIMCRTKQLLDLDILVDDYEFNLIGGKYLGLLMDRPWNQDIAPRAFRMKRIFHLSEVPNIVYELEKSYY
jgi:5'(3')-deoxyribonucleotidase